MSPGFVVVRISRGFAAASLDAPAILLVKDDHAVRGAHPRQTWGPVDVIAVSGSNFIATHVEGTTDPTTSLCVFGGSGASGGVIVSSALILCESPLTEPTRAKERWVAPCFEECDASTALPVGATPTKAHARVALTSMPHSYLTHVCAFVLVSRERIRCRPREFYERLLRWHAEDESVRLSQPPLPAAASALCLD